MRAILFDPFDGPTIEYIHGMFQHTLECTGCAEHMKSPEGRSLANRMFDFLNDKTSDDITTVEEAVEFCAAWLATRDMLGNLDGLIEAIPVAPNAKPH
jgi:hypothetical protein